MIGFIARRLAAGVVLLAAISALAFFLLYLGSGNIARKILGEGATPQTIAQENHRLGLDQSLPDSSATGQPEHSGETSGCPGSPGSPSCRPSPPGSPSRCPW